MANVVRNFVEGIGISDLTEINNPIWFTEVAIPELVCIPEQKPDMEQLMSVMVDAEIISTRVITTPIGKSYEGQNLSGKKLSVELLLRQKIRYVADEPTQSVHAAHFDKLIASIFIVIPCCFEIGGKIYTAEELLQLGKLVVTPYIEDIYGEQRGKRCIFKNITVLLNVTLR